MGTANDKGTVQGHVFVTNDMNLLKEARQGQRGYFTQKEVQISHRHSRSRKRQNVLDLLMDCSLLSDCERVCVLPY